jgi:Glycosyltransferase family 87
MPRFRPAEEVFRYRWIYLGLLIALAIWGWLDVVPRGMVNHQRINEHRTDFTVYTEAGAAFFDGRDPYQVSNPRGWRYLYPPMFAILVAPLHVLPPMGQVGVWFVLSVGMLFGCYFELRRILDFVLTQTARTAKDSARLNMCLCTAAIATALLPAFNCLQRGQVEVFKLYLLMLGFRIALTGTRARHWALAGLVFALAGILKLTPLLPVGCLLLYEARLAWVAWRQGQALSQAWQRPVVLGGGLTVGLLLFAFLIPAALTGWNGNLRHLHTWFSKVVTKVVDVRTSDFGEDVRSIRNQSLDNAAYRFGNFLTRKLDYGPDDTLVDHPHDASLRLPMDDWRSGMLIVAGRILALAILLGFVLRAGFANDPVGRGTVFGLACVATLVVCPVARGCYYVLFLPAIPFVCQRLVELSRLRSSEFVAWIPVVLVWLHYCLLPNSGRIGLLGLGTTVWFLATCVLLQRRPAVQTEPIPVRPATLVSQESPREELVAAI